MHSVHDPNAPRHGGPVDAELATLGLTASDLVDFSVNVNTYGPHPEVLRAIREAPLDRYPDPTAWTPRGELARALGVTREEILLGNGAVDILWTVARWSAREGLRALVVEPTFSEFRAACVSAGVHVTEWRASETTGFTFSLDRIARALADESAGIVYLCAPNTPTGGHVPAAELAAWAERQRSRTIVLDQSFLSLSEHAHEHDTPMPSNVLRVRSLTKDHAIPGVRVGYALAHPDLVRALERHQPSWNVNALALAAIQATCRHTDFVETSRQRLLADRRRLEHALAALSIPSLPSSTPFLMARVDHATRLRRYLLERHHILVRDCTSFGLPEFVRLAARPEPDVTRLIHALRDALGRT